jgi:hypothetical protein
METVNQCGQVVGDMLGLQNIGLTDVAQGQSASWQATAPSGLMIDGAAINTMYVNNVNNGLKYGGGFYWQGGGPQVSSGETSAFLGNFSSPYFGFQLVCGANPCPKAYKSDISVGEVVLDVRETVNPSISAPDGLWQAKSWVHGTWTLAYSGDSPSGVCSLNADFNGQEIAGTGSLPTKTTWHQCSAPPVSSTIDVDKYGQGALTLSLVATDAAGNNAAALEPIDVDSSTPTLTLSGATDAPSTAGTQYVTATAGGSPSGIAGISCSVDGGPAFWYPGTTAQVPVSGIGQHVVNCKALNNSLDEDGNHGTSTASWGMRIGVPTVAAIGFTKIVDALRCRRVEAKVTVPARWVKVRRHGRVVKTNRPARKRLEKITRCHARTAKRRVVVWVTTRRHGKKVRVRRSKTVRVLLLPHAVTQPRRVVRHGHGTTVSGWLGTADGTAIGGQTVQVLAAPDDGQGRFTQAAVVTTASNGGWSARLPAGPSRLVIATFGGGGATEPSTSTPVKLVVPAAVRLIGVSPRQVPWGGTVRLAGQLKGGYLPAGGALVRLRIGEGSAFTTYGVHEHVGGNGRFSTSYTFGVGEPSVVRSFWFQVASLPMGNYPYAPASSRRVSVVVGGDPKTRHRRR